VKYIELVGWGNKTPHLISERAIALFTFAKQYTTVHFVSGKTLNVVESKSDIIILLSNLNGKFSTLDHTAEKDRFEFDKMDPYYENGIYDE